MPKHKGRNKHQKAAHRPGEVRIGRAEVEQLLEMSCSADPDERAVAAQYLCPCHVRRRIEAAWVALYRMMEDPDVRVRRAAWHTLEDGGHPDDPAFRPILARALETEADPQVRRFVERFAELHRQQEVVTIRKAAQPRFPQRDKCDFCGATNVLVKMDFATEIAAAGKRPRFALICERCAEEGI